MTQATIRALKAHDVDTCLRVSQAVPRSYVPEDVSRSLRFAVQTEGAWFG